MQKYTIFKNNIQINAIFKNHNYPYQNECDITEKYHIQKQCMIGK